MNDIVIDLEDDPVPIVKIIGAQFRRSLQHPAFVRAARGFSGTFALASTADPQAVTIRGSGGRLSLTRGIAPEAAIIVRLDFNDLDKAPVVEGLWRHPMLALKVGKLMESYDPDWTECAKRFWERASDAPRLPNAIKVRCTDDDRSIVLGEGEPSVTLEGTASRLVELLTGSTVLVLAVMEGKIRVDGSLEHLTVLSEITKDMMLGER